MAVIDQNVAEKASQDKSKDTKNGSNSSQTRANEPSQDLSIQDIAERAFNTSYDAVGNVIRTSSKAGVERAIADFQKDIDNFERSFKKDFLQTIEAKSEPYEIGASALRLLSASGAETEIKTLTDRFDELVTLEQSSDISDEQLAELDGVEARLKELGVLKR
jgi:predicted DNA-binding protein YlxM (UPF0122 family)